MARLAPTSNGGAGGIKPRQVLLTGSHAELLRNDLESAGLHVVDSPDAAQAVVAYGGDGSLLGADRDFPDLPKLGIRRGTTHVKCQRHANPEVFGRLARGQCTITRLIRLQAEVRGQRFCALNDIVFHNARPASALRYRVDIDGTEYSDEIVGDGLIVATPFGSSAYYRSITHAVFRVGIGLAFNNSTESVNHLVLADTSCISIVVTRGPGLLFGDNMPDPIPVEEGDRIRIVKAPGEAVILDLETLTCKDCRELNTGRPAGFRHI